MTMIRRYVRQTAPVNIGDVSGRLRIQRAAAEQMNVLGESNGYATVRLMGLTVDGLVGVGSRAVVADANGVLSAP
jgi:hypothetical protein